jgi:hypothetical protein
LQPRKNYQTIRPIGTEALKVAVIKHKAIHEHANNLAKILQTLQKVSN